MSAIHLNLFKNREYDHLKKSVLAPFLVFFLMRWIMLMISNVSTGFECVDLNVDHQIIRL